MKGYEFARGQYVVFEPDELKALEAQSTHTIDHMEALKASLEARAARQPPQRAAKATRKAAARKRAAR